MSKHWENLSRKAPPHVRNYDLAEDFDKLQVHLKEFFEKDKGCGYPQDAIFTILYQLYLNAPSRSVKKKWRDSMALFFSEIVTSSLKDLHEENIEDSIEEMEKKNKL